MLQIKHEALFFSFKINILVFSFYTCFNIRETNTILLNIESFSIYFTNKKRMLFFVAFFSFIFPATG